MILKDGKFWDDKGNVVPIEHGNKEQIKLLERVQNLRTDGELLRGFEDEDIDGEIEKVSYRFTCLCGHKTEWHYTYEENNLLSTDSLVCSSCRLKYKIEACDFSEFFILIQMIKK